MEISIIVPIYNVKKYLDRCVQSILNQTFKDFELILVNDGSIDGSGERCEYYKKLDERVIIIHKLNGGLSDARNVGIEIARGKFLSFVDGDDFVHPQFLEVLYNNIIRENADMSVCAKIEINEEKDITYYKGVSNVKKAKVYSRSEAMLHILEDGIINVVAWNKLYKRELFNEIRYPIGKLHEDEYVIHKIIYKSKRIVYSNEELYYYVQRKGSIMNQLTEKRVLDLYYALEERIEFADKKKWSELEKAFHKRMLDFFYDVYINYKGCPSLFDKDIERKLSKMLRKEICQYGINRFSFETFVLSMGYTQYECYTRTKDSINTMMTEKIGLLRNLIVYIGVKFIPVNIKKKLLKLKIITKFLNVRNENGKK